jgi:outer membrane lipoprotein SlyB
LIKKPKTKGDTMKTLQFRSLLLAGAAITALSFTGCATKTQTGAAVGAGTGALLGQVIGGNTGSTLAGAAIGGLAGAAIGNNEEKKDRRRY